MPIVAIYRTTEGPDGEPIGAVVYRWGVDDPDRLVLPDGCAMRPDDGTPVWSPPPPPPIVPAQVPNASARRIMQRHFVDDGRSFFTIVQTFLQGQVAATAQLADANEMKIAALGAWTQWDMGNFFQRADPLVDALGELIASQGGDVDMDALFVAADAL